MQLSLFLVSATYNPGAKHNGVEEDDFTHLESKRRGTNEEYQGL
ncbi:hypothetical protein Dhaf_1771 [Desulfitobacterium hafniense DCB-2]|uniref:Uncharacterized protein n=2 Tax=Desulfitobacterium hafniense TaxID=49338 RepID=A0A098B5V9_DESHA|nr:hypothetical protein Dhaf_1771 [Desulfitobacterium hafniense DCB-2]CDX03770.1 Hypothetical protein DPCES_3884 [Desulfitobacterium hafniense]